MWLSFEDRLRAVFAEIDSKGTQAPNNGRKRLRPEILPLCNQDIFAIHWDRVSENTPRRFFLKHLGHRTVA